MTNCRSRLLAVCILLATAHDLSAQASADEFASHPPLRPLPEVSKRPMAKGPGFFVDPAKGNDDAAGSGR